MKIIRLIFNLSFVSVDVNASFYVHVFAFSLSVYVSMYMNVCGIILAESHTHRATGAEGVYVRGL